MLESKDYCDYDTCVALKELGFNEKCHGYYESLKRCFNTTSIKHSWCNSEVDDIGVIICPTLYEAQKWMREEKNAIIVVCPYTYNIVDETHTWTYEVWFEDNLEIEIHNFDSYEEALSEGIKEAVKILKEK